jgi:hypothetical protein
MSNNSDAKNERSVDIGGDVTKTILITGDHAQIHQPAGVPPPPALHQLPPPPRDFVGRSREMTELLQALETSGVTISGLQGLGGIGKTALALKLAACLKPKYPDAQFYLDLKGASKQPLSASEAMAHVCTSLMLCRQAIQADLRS